MFYSSKRKIKWFLLLILSMKLSLLFTSSMMRGHLLKQDLIMCNFHQTNNIRYSIHPKINIRFNTDLEEVGRDTKRYESVGGGRKK